MDKAIPPDHRKPPKLAQFPDAPGRASMCASSLVAGAGQRFESARRLFVFPANAVKARTPNMCIGGFVSSTSAADSIPMPRPRPRHFEATLTPPTMERQAHASCAVAASSASDPLTFAVWPMHPGFGGCATVEGASPGYREEVFREVRM